MKTSIALALLALAIVSAGAAGSSSKPPPLFLRTAAGTQHGAQGSYCIQTQGGGL